MTANTTAPLSPQEQKDEEMINAAFQHLKDTYLASNHRRKVDVITKAFNFAKQAHKGVRRLSGEPYILHPIAVAQIVCEEIGLGSTSICAALLHDVEEDTDYTNEDLTNLFGQKVGNIVEGLTKISGGIFGDKASLQAETFKKLLLTMSDDIRVILIKIADRLHNMRTLSSMAPRKQYKIASETIYIFAPIADRLGLNKIKTELENLSFRYEHPEEYRAIEQQLAQTQPERDTIFDKFTPPICQILDEMGVKYTLKARVKSSYSIWTKMQNKHIPFEEVYDILAIRIIFVPLDRDKEIVECYSIYGALTKIYTPHPTRFRDWLANPKANGYQALHNTFMSKQGKWIEVQIRSDRMDDIAEQGFAAHWKYKDKDAPYDENELDRWLNSIKEILDDPQPDTLDLLDTIKLNLYSNEILVFTPKGELKNMPVGSTVLDFAFSIHSFLGSHCFGAKVNHALVPLNYRLKSGDQVEVITTQKQHVQPEWLDFVTTAKARSKIQAILRRDRRSKSQRGETLLADFLKKNDITPSTAIVEKLTTFHGYAHREDFLIAIADEQVVPGDDDLNRLQGKRRWWRPRIPFIRRKTTTEETVVTATDAEEFVKQLDRKKTLVLNEDTLQHCTIAPCCNPISGDDVVGYITPQNQLEIHLRSCPDAVKLKTRYGNNIIACTWDTHRRRTFDCRLHISGVDSQGVLYAIADVLHKQQGFPVRRITLETKDGVFKGLVDIAVYDTDDVRQICASLQQIENVSKAVRVEL
jgi:GTP pyrophosphokinase